MKLFIKALSGTVLLAPLFLTGVVNAQAAPPAGSTFEQRLDQRKKERNIKLDEKTQKRLIEKCTAAQSTIRTVQQKLPQIFIDKAKMHQQIDGKLWVTIGQLKLAQKDTFDLENKRIAFAAKAVDNEATSKYFQQTVDDLVVVNCKADTVGFKALLDTARIYLTQERGQTAGLRSYVVDQIKPALDTQITGLQSNSTKKEGQ